MLGFIDMYPLTRPNPPKCNRRRGRLQGRGRPGKAHRDPSLMRARARARARAGWSSSEVFRGPRGTASDSRSTWITKSVAAPRPGCPPRSRTQSSNLAKVTQNQKSGRLRPSPWLRAQRSICSGCTAPGEGVGEPWQPRRTPRARLCGARARRKEELQQPLPSSLASLKNLKPWSLGKVEIQRLRFSAENKKRSAPGWGP